MEGKRFLKPLFCLAMMLICGSCLAQKKYEREYRIKPNAVPESALAFVSSVFQNPKVHWYGEESLTGKSIEAKLKASGKHYSIEFDESGEIQDVEILSKMSEVDPKVRATLKDNLSREFSKYKVVKTQLHWNGTEGELRKALLEKTVPKGVTVRHELVVRAKRDKTQGYFEVQSESNGKIVSVREIVQRNVDNLIY